MTTSISRRGVIAVSILFAGCRSRSEYFGNAAAPPRQTLKFAGPEPSTLDAGERMAKQAECERHVLQSMPIRPLFHNTWSCLQKPFVRGLPFNLLDLRLFKYASIDTNWRAQ